MKSPFPGMDPYLEDPAYWEDFHRRFITGIADDLLEHLPPQYDARIDQRVRLVDVASGEAVVRVPDVAVSTSSRGGRDEGGLAVVDAIEAIPVLMPETEEQREVWIEIRRRPDRSLVTSIEVLSPSNKTGEGRKDYANKRIELYGRGVNLVELDLLLGGERLHFRKPLPAKDYFASVARAARRPVADVYGWLLPERLPTIPVPLRVLDGDVPLDLGKVYAIAYERGRYASHLRYDAGLPAALPPVYSEWVRRFTGAITAP